MKKLITLFSLTITFLIISCGENKKPAQELESTDVKTSEMFEDAPAYDAKRGEGKWTAELLALSDKLDNKIATDGEISIHRENRIAKRDDIIEVSLVGQIFSLDK